MMRIITSFIVMILFFLLSIRSSFAQTGTAELRHFPTALESFEKWTAGVPNDWKVVNLRSGADTSWKRVTSLGPRSPSYAHSGDAAAMVSPSLSGKDLDDWLISPHYFLPEEGAVSLSFYCAAVGVGKIGKLEVLLSTTTSEPQSFVTVLDSIDLSEKVVLNQRNFTLKNLDLAAYKGKAIYIAFRAISSGQNGASVLIDDVQLYSPTYQSPSTVKIVEVGYTDALVSWKGTQSPKYEIVCSTVPLSFPDTGGIFRKTVTDTFAQITGLLSSRANYVYLRAVGSEYLKGFWVGPLPFYTLCEVLEAPYIANFSDLTCWATVDLKGSVKWTYNSTSKEMQYSYGYNDQIIPADDWLCSPKLQVGANQMVKFKYAAVSSSYNTPEYFSVWFIKDTQNIFEDAVELIPAKPYYNTSLDSIEIDLSSLAGKQGRLAIRNQVNGYSSSLKIKSFEFVETNCAPVYDLRILEQTTQGARIGWKSYGSDFEVKCSDQSNFSPNSATAALFEQQVVDPFVNIVGLDPGKTYYVFVRKRCSSEWVSSWKKIEFRPLLEVSSFPYVEDFSTWSVSQQPNFTGDWTVFDGNGDQNTFQGISSSTTQGVVAGGKLFHGLNINRNQWMFSPKFKIPEEKQMLCTFWVTTRFSTNIERMNVWVSETDRDTQNFRKLIPVIDFSVEGAFKPVYIDLSEFKGKSIYIAIQLASPITGSYFWVDDFSITESLIPTPTALKLDSSSYKQVSLSWSGSASSYRVAYQSYMFNPQQIAESILIPPTTEKHAHIDNLSSGTRYFFYVQAYNAEENTYSSWVGPISVVTSCEEIRTPFVETFDGWVGSVGLGKVDYPIGCWKYINLRSPLSTASFNDELSLESYSKSGSPWEAGKGISMFATGVVSTDTFDRYLITPMIRMPKDGAVLSYWISSINNKGYYSIELSTTGTRPEDFVHVLYRDSVKALVGLDKMNWEKKIVELKDKSNNLFPDSSVYIAFHFIGKNAIGGPVTVRLDDVILNEMIPGCSYPTSIASEAMGTTKVKVSWESTAPKFDFAYSNAYFNPNTDPYMGNYKNISGDGSKAEVVLDGLQPAEVYYVWIRGKCENGAATLWVGPDTIPGNCAGEINQFPFIHNFSQWSYTESPSPQLCWQTIGRVGDGFVGNKTGVKNLQAVPSMAAFSAYSCKRDPMSGQAQIDPLPALQTMDAWLITPHIDVIDSMQFSFKYRTGNELEETFYVLLSETGTSIADFKDTLGKVQIKWLVNNANLGDHCTFPGNLDSYIGKQVYLAIVHRTENRTEQSKEVGLTIDDFRLQRKVCPMPAQVVLSEVNPADSLALVSWEGNSESGWLIRYATDIFNPEKSGTEVSVPTGNTYNFKLNERGAVVFFIKAKDCSDTALWVGPYTVTFCGKPITKYPFTENFEDWSPGIHFTSCWTALDLDNDQIVFTSSTETPSGVYLFGRNSSKGGLLRGQLTSKKANNWLISPVFDMSELEYPVLEFWCQAGSSSYFSGTEDLKIFASAVEDPSIADFEANLLKEFHVENGYWSQVYGGYWVRVQVDLSSFAGESNVQLAIQHCTSGPSSIAFMMDDLRLRDVKSCKPVTDVKIQRVSTDSASISWRSDASAFLVRYGLGSINPADTTNKTVRTDNTPSSGSYEVTLPNLISGSEYLYYIAPVCTPQDTVWYGPYLLKTDCNVVKSYPYTEKFSNLKNFQRKDFSCWNVIDQNYDNKSFMGLISSKSDGGQAIVYAEKMKDADTANEYLVSPSILLPGSPKLSFSYGTSQSFEKFDLMIAKTNELRKSDGSYDLSKLEKLVTFNPNLGTDSTVIYTGTELPKLLPYVNKEVNFVIHYYSEHDTISGNYFVFDNFSLTSEDHCLLAPENLSVYAYTDTAIVSWTGKAGRWFLEYWKQEDGIKKTVTVDTLNTYILRNLTPNYTKYRVRVKPNCELISNEAWSDSVSFTTEPTCKPLYALDAVIGVDTLLLKLNAGTTSEIRYELKWAAQGASEENIQILSAKDTILRNLLPETQYLFYARKICSAGDTSRVLQNSFTTYYPCPSPMSLTLLNVGKREASLSWTSDRSSRQILSYRLKNTAVWSTDTLVGNTYTIENLLPGRIYEWTVQSECQRGNFSLVEQNLFSTLNLDRYQLEVQVNDESFGSTSGQGVYDEQSLVQVRATANPSYQFRYWQNLDGALLSTDSVYQFTLVSDTLLKAVFEKKCLAVTDLEVLSVSPDSCLLTWKGDSPAFLVYYKQKDMSVWDSVTVSESKLLLRDLQEMRTYEWKVRSICGDRMSEESEIKDFLAEGIDEPSTSRIQLLISPNPVSANGEVRIQLEGVRGYAELMIVDMFGRIVRRQNIQTAAVSIINCKGLAPGVYILKIQGPGWEKTERLLID